MGFGQDEGRIRALPYAYIYRQALITKFFIPAAFYTTMALAKVISPFKKVKKKTKKSKRKKGAQKGHEGHKQMMLDQQR